MRKIGRLCVVPNPILRCTVQVQDSQLSSNMTVMNHADDNPSIEKLLLQPCRLRTPLLSDVLRDLDFPLQLFSRLPLTPHLSPLPMSRLHRPYTPAPSHLISRNQPLLDPVPFRHLVRLHGRPQAVQVQAWVALTQLLHPCQRTAYNLLTLTYTLKPKLKLDPAHRHLLCLQPLPSHTHPHSPESGLTSSTRKPRSTQIHSCRSIPAFHRCNISS